MKKIILLLSISSVLFACQKVIDVDLNDADQKIVIVSTYSAVDSTLKAKITLTSSFFDSDPSPTVDNATVTIVDHLGNATTVPFLINGEYELSNYIPLFSTTYILNVVYDGITYSAECDLNPPVDLDPITYDSVPPSVFSSNGGYVVYANFNDPAGVVNNYQIILHKNSNVRDDLDQMITQDDNLTDGNYVQRPLFPKLFHYTDTVGMELRSIDVDIYNYLNQAIATASNQDSSAPGNPTSNWNNGALGYFSMYSSTYQEVIIP